MVRNWRLLVYFGMVLCVILISSGCRSTAPATQPTGLKIELSPPSTTVGAIELVLTVADSSGKPIENAKVQVVGDMTHAGMAPVTSAVEGGHGAVGKDGKYMLPFTWNMGGDWVLTVKVILPDGTTDTRTFNYTIKN
jgi:hypothetical protein